MFTLSIIDTQSEAVEGTLSTGGAITRDWLEAPYVLEVLPVDSAGFVASDTASVSLSLTDADGTTTELLASETPYRFDLPASLASGTSALTLTAMDAAGQPLANSAQTLDLEIINTEGWAGDVFTLQASSMMVDDGTSAADTVIRSATNPETSPAAGTDGLWDGASGGSYVDMGGQVGDAVSFSVDADVAGTYELDIRYASSSASGASRPMAVLVDGNQQETMFFAATGSGTQGWQTWSHATITLELESGTNEIRLENLIGGGPNIDSLTLTAPAGGGTPTPEPPPEPTPEPDTLVIQAEDTTLVSIDDDSAPGSNGLTRVVDADNPDALGDVLPGAIGDGYIDFGTNAGDAVTFQVTPDETGLYTATIRYANGGTGDRPLLLTVNGETPTLVSFPPTGSWSSWGEVSITVPLPATSNAVTLTLPSAAQGGVANGPNIDQISFEFADDLPDDPTQIFSIEGEELSIDDGSSAADTVVRDASNPETTGGGADGLWGDFSGSGYLDMGGQAGDAAFFNVSVAESGTYLLTIRYAASGSNDRPMALSVDGQAQGTIPFASTGTGTAGWENWTETTVQIDLQAGNNEVRLANVGNIGPNIDSLTLNTGAGPIDEPPTEPVERTVIRINFQPADAETPDDYFADTGLAFGQQSLQVDGQSHQYGWVTAASIADGTANGTTPMAIAGQDGDALGDRSGSLSGVDPLQATYAGFDKPGYSQSAGWEIELEDGYYEVTISIGDSGGAYDSVNVINAEGEQFNTPFTPGRPSDFPADGNPTNDSEGYRSTLVTQIVQVTDGRLTLDSIGVNSANTEIQYIEIQSLPDLTPGDDREAPEDYPFFTDPRAVAGVGESQVEIQLQAEDGSQPVGVDPTSDFFIGISVVDGRGGALLESLNDGSVRLFNTVTGEDVAFNINTTGGFDSLTISPVGTLDEFTSYTLVIDGFQDRGDNDDPSAPTREFQKFTSTFVTGADPEIPDSEVAFDANVELNGAEDGAYQFTSITMSPDNTQIYVSTMNGEIKRYDIDPLTGSLSNGQTLALDYFQGAEGARGIVGLVFDPVDPNVLWVTDNYPIPLTGRDNGVPDFSGQVTKITLGSSDSVFTGTAETYITGLPRSNGDHVTNSLTFRANPEYDAQTNPDVPPYLMYVSQGANTAMGGDDSAWGNRPERLLNAAILEIDPSREPPAGGFDVSTEPLPTDGSNTRYEDDDNDLKNGPIDMGGGQYLVFAADGTATMQDANGNVLIEYYDPFAEDAVLKIFATGIRNGYDLTWHSNGSLYVPTNGSAAGGSTPDDPATAINEGLINVGIEDDWLFRVEEGGYYGHPNPLHDEYILNGGNPTSGVDENETDEYAVGTSPDSNYREEDIYSLGTNRSPNGVIEYTSNIFGATLAGSLLFVEYSGGDDIRWISLDANGNVSSDTVLRDVDGNVISYVDPLDIIENPNTGQLYLMTLNRSNGQSQVIRLDPVPGDIIVPIGDNADLTSIATIQAEDDALAVIASGAQIAIRDGDNPEPTDVGSAYGVRPGAYGMDGNTVDSDGVVGGYADFGASVADFITFDVNVDADEAGEAVLRVRYANGGTANRPLEVFVNDVSVGVFAFAPPTGVSGNAAWNTWQTLDIPAALLAGANTVRLQATNNSGGPNIDQLEVLIEDTTADDGTPGDGTSEYSEYQAETATLEGGAVVIPETDDDRGANGTGFVDFVGSGDQTVTWSVDVAQSGVYEVTFRYSLTTGKADRPMALTVNGVEYPTVDFPALSQTVSDWVTRTVSVTLGAGANAIALTAPNAVGPDLDSLLVANTPSATAPGGDISVISTDPAYFDDRIAFNYLDDDDATPGAGAREYKDSGSVIISNNGSGDLDVASITVSGPFMLADPDAFDGLTLAPGESVEVEVLFNREAYTPPASNLDSGVFNGVLTILSDDADQPQTEIQLSGFWQARDEGGWEPNLNEMWEVFGFGNRIEGLSTFDGGGSSVLSDAGIYRAVSDHEVLSRYWQIAEGVESVTVTQLGAWHGYGGAPFTLHEVGDRTSSVTLMNHASAQSQTLLPMTASGNFVTASFTQDQIPESWLGSGIFGFGNAVYSSDPALNGAGTGNPTGDDAGLERGYMLRLYQALDSNGNAIPNTYFLATDYAGINYDYNDNVYLIEGIEPATRTPFNESGTPWSVGDNGLTLDAALYDEGAPYVTYEDSSETQLGSNFREGGVDIMGNGDAIGWIANGEWVEYTLDIEEAGVYSLSFLSSLGEQTGNPRSITAAFYSASGAYETATVDVGYTGGWSTFNETGSQNVELEAGVQTLRLTFNGGAQNLESFTLSPSSQTAFNETGTPWAVDGDGLTLDAALYDVGGAGIAYSDSSEEQLGTDFRGEGVDIRGEGDAIGWIADGEWVEYTLNVEEAGTYLLSFAAATNANGRTVTASVEQDDEVYTSAAPQPVTNTGGWNNYQANDGIELDLAAGEQVLRLTFNGGAMNVESFTLSAESAGSATTSSFSLASMLGMEEDGTSMLQQMEEIFSPSDDVTLAGVDDNPDSVTIA
ncbi:carbohydrate-binding protein [Salinicola avicenniae]|uniref:carbohydrate-binding protein n=1 Tax=Salinicola avicenniae TaxID=2916836 RepID=UPI002073A612|nr:MULTISPECIES: carbohydrate-binding protein [unclassified Salinicola]